MRYHFGLSREYAGPRRVMQKPRTVYAHAEKKAGPKIRLRGQQWPTSKPLSGLASTSASKTG